MMQNNLRQILSFFLAMVLTLGLTLPIPASASGPGDCAEAEITFPTGSVLDYNGSDQRPPISVTLNGRVLEEYIEYRVEYFHNRDAGQGQVTITGIGEGCTGTKTAYFTIRPRALYASDFAVRSYYKSYDGTRTADPEITVNVLPGDSVTASASQAQFESKYAGVQTLTASGITLSDPDAGNYTVEPESLTLSGQGQITPSQLRILSDGEVACGGYTLDLQTLYSHRPDGSVQLSFREDALGCQLEGTVLRSGTQTGTVSLDVIASEVDVNQDGRPEYDSGQEVLTVRLVGKEVQPPIEIPDDNKDPQPDPTPGPDHPGEGEGPSFDGPLEVTYGDTLQLRPTGGAGSGQLIYQVLNGTGRAEISAQGLLTPLKAGKVRVKVTRAGDDRYESSASTAVEVIIHPAVLTVTVRNRTAVVGDPMPPASGMLYDVSGLVGQDALRLLPNLRYETLPNMDYPGQVRILASGAAVPDSGNYDPNIRYIPGVLTIQPTPSYEIQIRDIPNGRITANCTEALPGDEVQLSVQPDSGFLLEDLWIRGEHGESVSVQKLDDTHYWFFMPKSPVQIKGSFKPEKPPVFMSFDDVRESDWFYEAVYYVYANGLMSGTSATQFQPEANTTRGMIVTILYRMENLPAAPNWSPFQDVHPKAYYADAISWAAWHGIVKGYSAVSFGPNHAITRQQLAAILYRYAEYKQWDTSAQGDLSRFRDAQQIQSYAQKPLSWACGVGLMSGTGQGMLKPEGMATRAQVATTFQRLAGLHPDR